MTFECPCIKNIFPSYNQQDATFLDSFISTDAVHVSGGSSAHHQEHITVHTASGTVNRYCCEHGWDGTHGQIPSPAHKIKLTYASQSMQWSGYRLKNIATWVQTLPDAELSTFSKASRTALEMILPSKKSIPRSFVGIKAPGGWSQLLIFIILTCRG